MTPNWTTSNSETRFIERLFHLTDRTANRLIRKMINCGSTFYPSYRSTANPAKYERKIETSWNQCTVCSSVMKLVVKVDDSNLLYLYGSKECQTVNSETSHWAQPTSAHLQHLCLCRKKTFTVRYPLLLFRHSPHFPVIKVVGYVIWLTDYKSVWFLSEIRGAMMYFTASCVVDFTTQRCMYDHNNSQTSNRRKLTVYVLHLTQEQHVGSELQGSPLLVPSN